MRGTLLLINPEANDNKKTSTDSLARTYKPEYVRISGLMNIPSKARTKATFAANTRKASHRFITLLLYLNLEAQRDLCISTSRALLRGYVITIESFDLRKL